MGKKKISGGPVIPDTDMSESWVNVYEQDRSYRRFYGMAHKSREAAMNTPSATRPVYRIHVIRK